MNLDNLFDLYPNPTLDHQASTAETTNLIACLAAFMSPSVVVEAGTYHGRTALAIAKVLRNQGEGFHIWTADTNEKFVGMAVNHAKDNHLAEHITFFQGEYLDMLESIPDDIDFAYIDGGVRGPLVEATLPRLGKDGLIVVDDMKGPWGANAGYDQVKERCGLLLNRYRGLGIISRV